jgi:hypothetical protein
MFGARSLRLRGRTKGSPLLELPNGVGVRNLRLRFGVPAKGRQAHA